MVLTMSDKEKLKVLLVVANPEGTVPLMLQPEERVIKESLRRSRNRSKISVKTLPAATVDDLRRELLEGNYQVVQFSSHGLPKGKLVLEDASNKRSVVPSKALAELLASYSPPIRCVILNACYSLPQGRLIARGVPITIAMEGWIDDAAGIEFSRGFYDAIGAGYDEPRAYEEGRTAVKTTLPKAKFKPRLLNGTKVRSAQPPRDPKGAAGANESSADLANLTIRIELESVGTNKVYKVTAPGNATVSWLVKEAQRAMAVKTEAEIGAADLLRIRWVPVDRRIDDAWKKLKPSDKRRVRAGIKNTDGVKWSYSETDRLYDIGVRDGVVFHLYAVPEAELRGGGGNLLPAKFGDEFR